MSATNAVNKKSGSSNSSMVNTPASTPVTTMANGQNTTQTSPPPNNNAPKYGTLVPNRIFVGGISANTTEGELLQLFSNYGTVKAAKIIQDRAGVSKGYGFITFESEDDAKRLQREADNIVLRERKLNIAPAIKKQPFSRAFDASSPPAVAPGNPAQYFFQPGTMPYFQGGVAYYPQPPTGPADPTTQQPTVYQTPSVYPPQSAPPQTAAYPPVMFPAQPIYMPQQYPMPMPYEYNYYPNGGAQYMVGGQGGPQSQVPPMQRPTSPPRPPCYSQQLPYTNPTDAMYYNMPIYGAVDGAMYADPSTMDMSMPNGALPEDNVQQQDIEIQSTSNMQKGASVETQKLFEVSQSDSTIRQSNTPVVSLLSLDQHQEKDLISMQSGRRRKLVPQATTPQNYSHQFEQNHTHQFAANNSHQFAPNNSHQYEQNHSNQFDQNHSFVNGFNYSDYTAPQSFVGFSPQTFNYQFAQPANPPSKTPPNVNGFEKNSWTKKWRCNERRSVETSSMSSIRTDSNSSASVVDENRNEEKVITTNPNSPPPTFNHINYKLFTTRNFQSNAVRPAKVNFEKRGAFSNNPRFTSSFRDFNINRSNNNNKETTYPVPNSFSKPPISPVPQMHASPHFVPPSRRNRRSVRRNGSSSLSEIGAGDAPLPNVDVQEACNKLDSLKL